MAFSLADGYTSVMAFFPAYPDPVERVLVAAGTCALMAQRMQQHASSSGSSKAGAGPLRVRWPQLVLQRLLGMALDWRHDPALAERE